MVHVIKITGAQEVINNFRRFNKDLGNVMHNRLVRAGRYLQRKSMQIVPVDTGNLKASADCKALGKGWDTDVQVYYTAGYAVYVHENTKALHGAAYNARYGGPGKTLRGPNQQAKFLERPAREEAPKILKILAGEGLGA